MRVPRISLGKLFNVLQSFIGRMASWPMRNIETFSSKQMYLYLSLVEKKVTEFYHNIDRRRYLVWLKWLIFIAFFRTIDGVLVVLHSTMGEHLLFQRARHTKWLLHSTHLYGWTEYLSSMPVPEDANIVCDICACRGKGGAFFIIWTWVEVSYWL